MHLQRALKLPSDRGGFTQFLFDRMDVNVISYLESLLMVRLIHKLFKDAVSVAEAM